MKRITSIVLCVLMLISLFTFTAGAAPTNIAQGKPYTYSGNLALHGDNGDTDNVELTDGIIGTEATIWGSDWVLCPSMAEKNSLVITIDLGKTCTISGIETNFLIDAPSGTSYPVDITLKVGDSAESAVEASTKTFEYLGDTSIQNYKQDLTSPVSGRYAVVTINGNPYSWGTFFAFDEIMLYGTEPTEESEPEESEESVPAVSEEESVPAVSEEESVPDVSEEAPKEPTDPAILNSLAYKKSYRYTLGGAIDSNGGDADCTKLNDGTFAGSSSLWDSDWIVMKSREGATTTKILFDLGSSKDIGSVVTNFLIDNGSGASYPVSYKISVGDSESSLSLVASETYEWLDDKATIRKELKFNSVKGRYVELCFEGNPYGWDTFYGIDEVLIYAPGEVPQPGTGDSVALTVALMSLSLIIAVCAAIIIGKRIKSTR